MPGKAFVLTVIGRDKPGIIAEVTGALFRERCNLEDISMTILEGEFAMILISHYQTTTQAEKLQHAFDQLGKKRGLSIYWNEVRQKLVRGESSKKGTKNYLITAFGKDKTGIVHKISQMLSKSRLNITDLNSRILGRGRKSLYAMMLEVDVPRSYALKKLEKKLAAMEKQLRVEIQIRPVERIDL